MSPLSKHVEEAGVTGIGRKALPMRLRPEDFFTECDEVRRLFSELVSAGAPERVAIIPAASYGLATVARNTKLARGQNVVTVDRQFPSNVHAWTRACDASGAVMRAVEAPFEGAGRTEAWNEALLETIDTDTAVVALEPVHWTDGTRFDLEAIGARAREVGAAFVVDGTQSVGAEPFDVARLQPDALVCAAYKWLTGPYSIGAAYFGPRYDDGVPLEESWLTREGSRDFGNLVRSDEGYRPGAVRYDVGETPNFILIPMFIAALEQLLEWGVANIADYIRILTDPLFGDERLDGQGLAQCPPDSRHLFGLTLPEDVDPLEVKASLGAGDVFVSVRCQVIRVSPHVYNDQDDIQALVRALEGFLESGC